jgi:hypothetical protein
LHRFGFLNTIITDLGSNFTTNQFWEFYETACIEVKYVSVAHPRANGQVEGANGMIIDGLKKRLYDGLKARRTMSDPGPRDYVHNVV